MAHSIKGVAGNIGMTGLQRAAGNLETALRDKIKAEYSALMALFSQELPVVLSSVDQLTGSAVKDAPLPQGMEIKSEKELAVMLDALAPFVKKREAKPAKDRMKEISALAWPEKFEPDVRELSRLIAEYQFKPAAELIEKMLVNSTF